MLGTQYNCRQSDAKNSVLIQFFPQLFGKLSSGYLCLVPLFYSYFGALHASIPNLIMINRYVSLVVGLVWHGKIPLS